MEAIGTREKGDAEEKVAAHKKVRARERERERERMEKEALLMDGTKYW